MKIIVNIVILLSVLVLASCKKNSLNSSEYISFVEDESNNLLKKKAIEGLHFQMQYCPAEYLLLNEQKTTPVSGQMVDQKKRDNINMLFFKLRINSEGNGDVLNYNIQSQDDYYARTQYLSYGFEEDIALVNGADTLFPAVFHFERTYGVAPFADFMIAFDTELKAQQDFQILIDDKVFNTGLLKFTYSYPDLQNIPQLKTN